MQEPAGLDTQLENTIIEGDDIATKVMAFLSGEGLTGKQVSHSGGIRILVSEQGKKGRFTPMGHVTIEGNDLDVRATTTASAWARRLRTAFNG